MGKTVKGLGLIVVFATLIVLCLGSSLVFAQLPPENYDHLFVSDENLDAIYWLFDLTGDEDALDPGEAGTFYDATGAGVDLKQPLYIGFDSTEVLFTADACLDALYELNDLNEDGDALDVGEFDVYYDNTSPEINLKIPCVLRIDSQNELFLGDDSLKSILRFRDLNGDGDALDPGEVWPFYNKDAAGPDPRNTRGLAFDASGILYWLDKSSSSPWGSIYKLQDLNGDEDALDSGEITLFYDGSDGRHQLVNPYGLVFDNDGWLYTSCSTERKVYRLKDLNGDGDALDAGEFQVFYDDNGDISLQFPRDLAFNSGGDLFVLDRQQNLILRLRDSNADGDAVDPGETTIFYDVTAAGPSLQLPTSITFGPLGPCHTLELTVEPLSPQGIDEGGSLSLIVTATHAGPAHTLTLSASGLPSFSSGWDGKGGSTPLVDTVYFAPDYCDSGDYQFTFYASCTGGLADTVNYVLTVNDVNRAPTISDPGGQAVDEGSSLVFSVTGSDPDVCDGDLVTLSALNLPAGANFTNGTGNPVTGTFNWTPGYCEDGVYTVSFIATDDHSPVLADTVEVVITVNNVNREPTITANPCCNIAVYPGDLVHIDIWATDPDLQCVPPSSTDTLTLGALHSTGGSFFWTPYDTSGYYEWTPSPGDTGVYPISFYVNDRYGGADTIDCQITVSTHALELTVEPASPQGIDEGGSLSLIVTATHAGPAHTLTLSASGLPSFSSGWDGKSGATPLIDTVSFNPDYCDSGSYQFSFYASCTGGLADTVDYVLTVNDVNRAPTISDPGAQAVDEGSSLVFSVTGSDPDVCDGDLVTLSALNLPAGANFTNGTGNPVTGTFNWTPGYCEDGVYTVSFIATDDHPPVLADTVEVVITVNNVNREPSITADPCCNIAVYPGGPVHIDIWATDPDIHCIPPSTTDTLTLGMLHSTGGSFSWTPYDTSGYYEWTPSPGDTGVYPISFWVNDRYGGADTIDCQITVSCHTLELTVTPPSPQVMDEGGSLSLIVTATHAGPAHTLTLSASGLPSFSSGWDGKGGSTPLVDTVYFNPGYCDSGDYQFTFYASCTGGLADTVNYVLTVNDVNRAPTISDPGGQAVDEGSSLVFSVTGSDPDTCDGDLVTLSALNLPAGANFTNGTGNPVTGTFNWTPGYCEDGVYTVSFIATDDHSPVLADTVEVVITVNNVNREPSITANPCCNIAVYPGELVHIDIWATDRDLQCMPPSSTDTLTLGAIHSTGGSLFWTPYDTSGYYEWTPSPGDTGVYPISFWVNDRYGGADTIDCQITVYSIGCLPEVNLGDTVSVWPGADFCIPINLSNGVEIGGYDFLLHYDPSVLTVTDVTDSAGLEYFNWSSWQVDDGQKLRIIGIANKPNQVNTPPIPAGCSQEVAEVCFHVSAKWNPNYATPISFEIDDSCRDNTLSDALGTMLYQATENWYWVADHMEWDPVPHCLGAEAIFKLSGTQVRGVEIEGPYGDVNHDGIGFTIADAVYFMEYLKGVVDSLPDPTYQGTASDVNLDGHQWTIADLIYLVNIVNGSAQRPGGGGAKVVAQGLNLTVRGSTVSVDRPIAGLYLVIKGGGEPVLKASGMEMETKVVNGERRILIIGAGWKTATAMGNLVSIPGEFQIKEVQVSDAGGWLMATKLVLIPTQFALHQNYPNPFNSTTLIRYALPAVSSQQSAVSLEIYNILGERVATLVQGKQTAGYKVVTWNAADVASGVYFYRLKAGSFTATRKMVLMK